MHSTTTPVSRSGGSCCGLLLLLLQAQQVATSSYACAHTVTDRCCRAARAFRSARAVKGGEREGSLIKTLKWSRAPDGKAYFINASLNDKANSMSRSASVSLTPAEFYMLKRLVDASFFHLLGWDLVFQG